jgi:hypothetical protein
MQAEQEALREQQKGERGRQMLGGLFRDWADNGMAGRGTVDKLRGEYNTQDAAAIKENYLNTELIAKVKEAEIAAKLGDLEAVARIKGEIDKIKSEIAKTRAEVAEKMHKTSVDRYGHELQARAQSEGQATQLQIGRERNAAAIKEASIRAAAGERLTHDEQLMLKAEAELLRDPGYKILSETVNKPYTLKKDRDTAQAKMDTMRADLYKKYKIAMPQATAPAAGGLSPEKQREVDRILGIGK